ncbi:MAG: hypothetical protein ABFD98_19610 [Syntrophobacteraceae bacterium]|nr:hypothetical protein [Desulfobacteraceae bacterium]
MKRTALAACLIVCATLAPLHPAPPVSAEEAYSKVIVHLASWRHPAKDVLARHKVVLRKMAFLRNNTYPVFFVDLPYDPQTNASRSFYHALYLELLEANGHCDYALASERDRIRIQIKWDKARETISEDIVPLQKSQASR